jgi:hypothetical protein
MSYLPTLRLCSSRSLTSGSTGELLALREGWLPKLLALHIHHVVAHRAS